MFTMSSDKNQRKKYSFRVPLRVKDKHRDGSLQYSPCDVLLASAQGGCEGGGGEAFGGGRPAGGRVADRHGYVVFSDRQSVHLHHGLRRAVLKHQPERFNDLGG